MSKKRGVIHDIFRVQFDNELTPANKLELRDEMLTFYDSKYGKSKRGIVRNTIKSWFRKDSDIEPDISPKSMRFIHRYILNIKATRDGEWSQGREELWVTIEKDTSKYDDNENKSVPSKRRRNTDAGSVIHQDLMFEYFSKIRLMSEQSCVDICGGLSGKYYAFRFFNNDEIVQSILEIYPYDEMDKVPHFTLSTKSHRGKERTAKGQIVDFGTTLAFFGFIVGVGVHPWAGTVDIILNRSDFFEDKKLFGVFMIKTPGNKYFFGRVGVVREADASISNVGIKKISDIRRDDNSIMGYFDYDQLAVNVGDEPFLGPVTGKIGKI